MLCNNKWKKGKFHNIHLAFSFTKAKANTNFILLKLWRSSFCPKLLSRLKNILALFMNGMCFGGGSSLPWSEYQRRMVSAVTIIEARKKLVLIYLVQKCESDVVNRLLILSYLQMKMDFLYFEFFSLHVDFSLLMSSRSKIFIAYAYIS